jgi:hypothetical protein
MISISGRAIRIIQNNTGSITFQFFDVEGKELNLVDYVVTFMIKRKKVDSDEDAIVTASFENIDDYKVTVDLSDKDTSADVGPYWWSVKLTGDNYENEALSGPFFILEGVQD